MIKKPKKAKKKVAPRAPPIPPPTFDNFVPVTTVNPTDPAVSESGWVNMDHVLLIRPNTSGGSSVRLVNGQTYDINEAPATVLRK